MSDLMLDVDQAGEIKAAFRRGGWTNAEIRKACEGEFIAQVRDVLLGRAEIRRCEHIINCDVPVFTPDGWHVLPDEEQLPNRILGQFVWNPKEVTLHIVDGKKNGKWIEGNKLRKELAKQPVYTAHLLDYLLVPENQYLIPEDWKGKWIFFWGAIYRGDDGYSCVRCLRWVGGRWSWFCCSLGDLWSVNDPVAVRAST